MTIKNPYTKYNKYQNRGMSCQGHAKFADKKSRAWGSDFALMPVGIGHLPQDGNEYPRYSLAPNAARSSRLTTDLVRNENSSGNIAQWPVVIRAGGRSSGRRGACKPVSIVVSNITVLLLFCRRGRDIVPMFAIERTLRSMVSRTKKWLTGFAKTAERNLPFRSVGSRNSKIPANIVPRNVGMKYNEPEVPCLAVQKELSGVKGKELSPIAMAMCMNMTRCAINLSASIAWLWSKCWAGLWKKEKRSIIGTAIEPIMNQGILNWLLEITSPGKGSAMFMDMTLSGFFWRTTA